MKTRTKALKEDIVTSLEEENKNVSYEAALEGIILLENDGTLPLETGKIALYGAGASKTIKGGTGSGEVSERHVISIYEGLFDAGFDVTTKDWILEYEKLYDEGEKAFGENFKKRMLKEGKGFLFNFMNEIYKHPVGQPITEEDVKKSETDTCIYVVSRQAGEGADRKLSGGQNQLVEGEIEHLKFCREKYEKLIVVINVGSTFDMSFVDDIKPNSVLFFPGEGCMGGAAFADLLKGYTSPSAKTVDTWSYKYEDIPNGMEYSYLNENLDEEYYKEGIYVGYRYFDSFDIKPRYAFGYGLSYTDFDMSVLKMEMDKCVFRAEVNVKNIGKEYKGKEVVQIYVSAPEKGINKEFKKLVAFAKTKEIFPGDDDTVTLHFNIKDMASYDEKLHSYILDKGDYIIRMGNSSDNTKIIGKIVLDKDAVVSVCTNICLNTIDVKEIAAPARKAEEIPLDIKAFELAAEDVNMKVHEYETPGIYSSRNLDPVLNSLSVKEMAELVVGAGMMKTKQHYFDAPGAVGFTTSELLEKGIPNICLADGPAGLRLQKRAVALKNGTYKGCEPAISAMKYFPEIIKKRMIGNPEKNPVVYQFVTSFPVGISLASTWNSDLLYRVGDAVGKEMETYGITYWLAPGMNIHRNPLCGRNFEYYSEDPYLTGMMAAAVTKGVQGHRGCYVTIKHFCCNNQEDNRNKTNANVNERALREIYLKGFEIAVRESDPKALMTCYNKVNGRYVANNYDLVTKALRNEFGFDGVVMTDWMSTGEGLGSDTECITVGNDLIMPGNEKAKKQIVKAVRSGEISEEDLKRCAANVLRGVLSSRIYQGYNKDMKKIEEKSNK